MPERDVTILVLSDLHYINEAEHACAIERRINWMGPLLIRKALLRMKHLGTAVDAVVLLGDLVDNGDAPGAERDLAALRDELAAVDCPVLVVPGNHDGPKRRIVEAFGCPEGLVDVKGVGLAVFHDNMGAGDVTTRPERGLELLKGIRAAHPSMPLVALQHNPMWPDVPSTSYPYMPSNGKDIVDGYTDAGVALSLSGHYHHGQPARQHRGTLYYTVPALCESPFRFAVVTMRDGRPTVTEHQLQMTAPGLLDVHCHTEYAYCGTTVAAGANVETARLMGLERVCLTEHAFHLYFDRDEAWSYDWQHDDAMVGRAMEAGRGRMVRYREMVEPARSEFVRLGLEVDLRRDGSLLLNEVDRDGWDVLVGALHRIPAWSEGELTQQRAERLFMDEAEKMLATGVQVLAHPFRIFRRSKMERPEHLYEPLAELLARYGVAAEVNYHTNNPDLAFVAACVDRGVKIALGSDSHDLAEVGEFWPHLNCLKRAGVDEGRLGEVLFKVT